MKQLYIDIGPLLEDRWTGIPVFTRRLINALKRSDRVTVRYCYELHELPVELIDHAVSVASGTSLRSNLFQHYSSLLKLCDSGTPILYPSSKHITSSLGQTASTVHDMSTLVMPENHEASNVAYHLDSLKDELATDEVVFCVSEATRAALIGAFPSIKRKTRVIYQYVDWPANFASMELRAPPIEIGRYAVVIGTIEPRKNLGLLLRAAADEAFNKLDLKLVVIGKKGWLVDQFLSSLTEQEKSRVIFTGFISEFDKYRLIKNSELLIYPSMYEGFGIPALEALSLGKPVVASMASCFPEIIGESGFFFDPFSVTELTFAVGQAINLGGDPAFRAAAYKRSQYFNPGRMAAPVLEWLEG